MIITTLTTLVTIYSHLPVQYYALLTPASLILY